MQRYYFNFFDGTQWLSDSIGQEAESLHELRIEARLALIELSKSYLSKNDSCSLLYNIIDESGSIVCRVKMSLIEEIFIK